MSLKYKLAFILVFSTGVLVRALYSFVAYTNFNWDEAPQALMARQIAEGRILPLVHFQLPYIGAVEQYPLALAMLVLGDGIETLRLFYCCLSLVGLVAIIAYYHRVLPLHWAIIASLLFALSPPLVLLLSLQGYSFGGLVTFSSLALLGTSLFKKEKSNKGMVFALGIVCGLSLYNNILSLSIAVFCFWVVIRQVGHIRYFAGGLFIGYCPMLAFNIANDFVSYKILVAKFLGVTESMTIERGVFWAIIDGFVAKLSGRGPTGLDIEPLYTFPSVFSHAGRPLQSIALIVLLALVFLAYTTLSAKLRSPESLTAHGEEHRLAYYLCAGFIFITALGQVRYMTALLPVLPLLVCEGMSAAWQRQKHLAGLASALLIFYMAFAHVAAYRESRGMHGETTFEIVDKLNELGLQYGYGSHEHQTYVAFLSRERIKISPQIGPIYLDKIPHFSQLVDQQKDVFYILPSNSEYVHILDERKITYRLEKLPGVWILYDFSERVYPIDLISDEEMARPDGYRRWSYKERPEVLNLYRGGH